jgi:two-component system phosphate regulon sensor histidine kinase PhoR
MARGRAMIRAMPTVPTRAFLRFLLLLAAPALLVLAALVVWDALAWGPALIAAAAIMLALAFPLHRHLRALEALRQRVETAPAPDARGHRRAPAYPGTDEKSVMAGLPDPLLLLDAETVIRRANPAARQLLGAALEGQPLVAALRQPVLLDACEAVLRDGGGREVEIVLPGRIERHFAARIAALPEAGPEGAAAVVTLHDITAVRRAERMRADFVANASHELRTPLASLVGFIETLQGPARDDPEARERFLLIMREQAERMTHLLDDLLSLSRIEIDEHVPPTDETDLRGVLEGIISGLELRARERGMAIELDMPNGPIMVRGDGDQLSQVFQNIIDNAIKYGREGTPVRIVVNLPELPGRDVSVAVIDQGEGIAANHIPRLTERFYRVDSARSRALGGTGLGLAIVKHIVNRHRGRLEIDSTPGEGSRFTVFLPAASA